MKITSKNVHDGTGTTHININIECTDFHVVSCLVHGFLKSRENEINRPGSSMGDAVELAKKIAGLL